LNKLKLVTLRYQYQLQNTTELSIVKCLGNKSDQSYPIFDWLDEKWGNYQFDNA